MRTTALAAVIAAVILCPALSNAQTDTYPNPPFYSTSPEANRLKATGALNLRWNCTGTLIAGADVPSDSTPALAVTAGHCALGGVYYETVFDQPYAGDFIPGNFADRSTTALTFPTKRIVYASTAQVDVALIELGVTYGELRAAGFEPVRFDTTPMTAGEAIENPQVPMLPHQPQHLRLAACAHGQTSAMSAKGEEFALSPALWTSCHGIPGASGSPLIRKGSQDVAGIMAMDTRSLLTPDPDNQKTVFSPIDMLARAIRDDSSVDVSELGSADDMILWQAAPSDGNDPEQRVLYVENADVYSQVRTKHGPGETTYCDDPEGYGEPLSTADGQAHAFSVSSEAKVEVMCSIGYREADGIWQPFRDARLYSLNGYEFR